MLAEVLDAIHNWFPQERVYGIFTVRDGSLYAPDVEIQDGQYFRIIGSVFNDGLHRWPANDLVDEVFGGEVWTLAIPRDVIALSQEIAEWRAENPESPYSSESFGGYSYSRPTGSDGAPLTWKGVFARRLDRWRKLPC